jgi:succinoglycan biosynthesis transport protein ExoP
MGGYLAMDLPRRVAFVRARFGLLALIAVVAGVVALGVSLAQPERFRASVDLLLGRTTGAASLVAGAAGIATVPEAQPANLALATLDTVAARVKARLPGPLTVDDLKRAVDVRFTTNSGLMTVTAESSKPARAALIANAFADEIVALRRETAQAEVRQTIDTVSRRLRQREAVRAAGPEGGAASTPGEISSLRERLARLQILQLLQTGDMQIVEPAVPPRKPSSPKPLRNAILASFVGLIVGILVLVLVPRVDDHLRDEDELTALIPASVLARIPEARFRHPHAAHQDPAFTEAFRFLCSHLRLMRPEGRSLVVTVTSHADGDGKTTVVSWIAHSLALSGADVVAVDFDLDNPGLHSCFDVPQQPDGATVNPHLRVVSGAEPSAPPSALIEAQGLQHMLEQLRDGADFVLVDTAPVSTVAETSVAAAAADGVILVVDLHRIRRKDLLAVKRQLASARAKILGIVLNRVPASSLAYVPEERARVKPEPAGRFGPPTFTA